MTEQTENAPGGLGNASLAGEEPTMEDILASIRKIISEDEPVAMESPEDFAVDLKSDAELEVANFEGDDAMDDFMASLDNPVDSSVESLMPAAGATAALGAPAAGVVDLDLEAALAEIDKEPDDLALEIPDIDDLTPGSELDALELDLAATDDDISALLDAEIEMAPEPVAEASIEDAIAEAKTSLEDVPTLEKVPNIEDVPSLEEVPGLEEDLSGYDEPQEDMDALLDDILADTEEDVVGEAAFEAELDIPEQATVANDPDLELVKSLMADLADDGSTGSEVVSEMDDIQFNGDDAQLNGDDGLDDILNGLSEEIDLEALTPDAEASALDDLLGIESLEDSLEEQSPEEHSLEETSLEETSLEDIGLDDQLSVDSITDDVLEDEALLADIFDDAPGLEEAGLEEADITVDEAAGEDDILGEILELTLEDELSAHPDELDEADELDGVMDTLTSDAVAIDELANIDANDVIAAEAGPAEPLSLSDIAAAAEADAIAAEAGGSSAMLAGAAGAAAGVGAVAMAAVTDQADDDMRAETDIEANLEALIAQAEADVASAEDTLLSEDAGSTDTQEIIETQIDSQEEADMPAKAVKTETIIDDVTETAAAGAFAELNAVVEEKAVFSERGPRIGDLVQDALRPMLKEWLDANLKGIVERAVAKEVKRISSGK